MGKFIFPHHKCYGLQSFFVFFFRTESSIRCVSLAALASTDMCVELQSLEYERVCQGKCFDEVSHFEKIFSNANLRSVYGSELQNEQKSTADNFRLRVIRFGLLGVLSCFKKVRLLQRHPCDRACALLKPMHSL